MSFFSDFKKFLMKGDIVALATAVVIGAAFKTIVDSAVKDVITPIIGLLTGGVDFTKKFISLDGETYASLEAAREAKAAVITYGNLIQALINFVIVGLFIFLFLRAYEKTKKKEDPKPVAAPKGPTQEELLAEIRDELKKQNT
ncbi:large conductance mechanosensitive channel protein MscL [Mesonia sp.]|uniref:large conductance mechanosensitive channel protein MscL n=1 Tax=Mesonia sp. TaxID=1960830 RepID=UPI0017767245|nr:large conductance mechanosensitive channel protein MscL [Mesonia sp.]HIB36154.1 large conductance mechanosensitive channel protein MscL [Mesonia sp.]HIO28017.1 large conductance mechanosensitive channel protein MscL [Flavobacteriaceae bacterium]